MFFMVFPMETRNLRGLLGQGFHACKRLVDELSPAACLHGFLATACSRNLS